MKLLHQWSDFYRQRLDWAERARHEFLESLDEELKKQFPPKGSSVSLVMYGGTQVGKTTLLLKLLGISESRLVEAASILRGRREDGFSATATVMLYGKSSDESWVTVHLNQKRIFAKAKDVEDFLANVRLEVESGKYGLKEEITPIEIQIPESWFESNIKSFDIKILDLPGINPSNSNEASHVKTLAAKFIPLADIILLVGSVSKLGFLKPEWLDLPLIEDWRDLPGRFRVITTHVSEGASLSRTLSRSKEFTIGDLKKLVREQVETHEISMTDNHLIYPLEFGKSWERLREKDSEKFLVLKPIIDEIYNELLQDIRQSATINNRILQTADIHAYVQMKKKSFEDGIRLERLKLKAEIKTLKDLLDASKTLLDDHILELNRLLKKILSDEEVQQALIIDVSFIVIEDQVRNLKMRSQVRSFLDQLTTIQSLLSSQANTLKNDLEKKYDISLEEDISSELINNTINGSFRVFRKHLKDYFWDDYWPGDFETFKNDSKKLIDCITDAETALRTLFYNHTELKMKSSIAQFNVAKESVAVQVKGKKSEIVDIEKKLRKFDDKLIKLKSTEDEFHRKMDYNLIQAEKFQEILEQNFLRAQSQIAVQMIDKPDSAKVILLCKIIQLRNERDKLLVLKKS